MFDVENIVRSGGILIVALIVFAESGLLIGFFLPGDTLLFSAGLIASQGALPLPLLLFVTSLAAIVGDNVGYSIGQKTGSKIFTKEDGILFQKDHLRRAEEFYEKHGGKTITIARFVPIVRTFAPVVAGAGNMPRRRFMFYNVVGAITWVVSLTMVGYWLGGKIPHLADYIEYVLIGVVAISLIGSFFHIIREPKVRRALSQKKKITWHNIIKK